ncbi:MAG: carbohydrate kinase family protein [Lachnospiraceae bacterium]
MDQKETVINLVREAKKAGAILCADTKIPTFRQLMPQDISEILPLIDYLFPNENEAALFTGKQDYMEMAEALHARWASRTVIVKAGKDGCYACSDTERFHMPAHPVKAIDSTGAGDSFVAGFIAGLLEQKSLWECCEKGTKCAAECVGHAGAV